MFYHSDTEEARMVKMDAAEMWVFPFSPDSSPESLPARVQIRSPHRSEFRVLLHVYYNLDYPVALVPLLSHLWFPMLPIYHVAMMDVLS